MKVIKNKFAGSRCFSVVALVVAGILFCAVSGFAQLMPPNPYFQLDYWSFNSTNVAAGWLSDSNCVPLSFTNLENPPDWDGNALEVDSTNIAWLQYPIVADGLTNITFDQGTISMWVLPNWNSGAGPGDWGRLIDVGAYSTNNPSSWWSLYFSPDGNNLCFSSETNGVFTNYFSYPISWNSNTWYFIALTYETPFQSDLYIDGQLVTNGGAMNYVPNAETLSNGLFVASDVTGLQQARSLIDDLATYNYAMSEDEVTNEYLDGWDYMNGITNQNNDNGNGGDNYNPGGVTPPDYGSNMWLSLQGVSGDRLNLMPTNLESDVLYEVEGCTNLASPNWVSYGFVGGPETTNCVLTSVPISQQGNLFLRILSCQDSTGTGIPDWWWYRWFGQITNVSAYASIANDGYDNLQKFEMGLDPTDYFNPNPPPGFVAYTAGTNIVLYWQYAPGPVENYAIQRGVLNTNGNYCYTDFLVSSNATNFVDVGVLTNANSINDIYNMYAAYPGNSDYSGTNFWAVSWGNLLPAPATLYAYPDTTGTNVLLSWTPVTNSLLTGYIIERGTYNVNSYGYTFITNAIVSNNITSFEDVGILTNITNWSDVYQVAAVYPGGGLSAYVQSFYDYYLPIQVGFEGGLAGPTNFYGYGTYAEYPYVTDTNIYLNWTAASGSVSNYIIYAGNDDGPNDYTLFQQIATVGSNTTSYVVSGGLNYAGNPQYSTFVLVAVYTNGSQSQGVYWNWLGGASGPASLEAYVDLTGTNIILSWNAVSNATGYVIQESQFDDNNFSPIATNNATALAYTDSDTIAYYQWIDTNYDFYADPSNTWYQVQAIFPDGNFSAPATAQASDTPPPPPTPPATGLTATLDSTGTNVLLSWTAASGSVSNYIVEEGTYDPETGTYNYSQIATTTGTSYEVYGAIANDDSYNVSYEVIANYGSGELASPDSFNFSASITPPPTSNISLGAQLVRNETGHWQLMFSSIPTNVVTIAFYWYIYGYLSDGYGPDTDPYDQSFTTENDIPVSSITNDIYIIPDDLTTNWIPSNEWGKLGVIQPITATGDRGNVSQVGFQFADAPCFTDGRVHLKQNLLFQLRSATISQPNAPLNENIYAGEGSIQWFPLGIPVDSNYVESSIFHLDYQMNEFDLTTVPLYFLFDGVNEFVAEDDLWPFNANYQLHGGLYDTNYTGPSYFVWQTNLVTVPAPPILGIGDPYWISQNFGDLADVGAYTNDGNLYFQSGLQNLFGLSFETALVNEGYVGYTINPSTGLPEYTTNPPVYLAPGTSTGYTNANCWFSQTVDPTLLLTNYYFAPVVTPGTGLTGFTTPIQPYPIPALTGFDNTNQTQIMVTSVGTPTVIGGWARFAIANGDTMKYAYLGQYYETNAFVVTNGLVTTNTTGVVSPYGDFFPTQPGEVAMVTMPDIDTGQQGTGVVDVISLNVDANHDGTMDLTFNGPDFVSANNPYRFWVNDDEDLYDYGGNGGIPGVQPTSEQDGYNYQEVDYNDNPLYRIHGTRDLVDFFPVYVNIGSLFESNALSAGISYTDTNWQFVLSQNDEVLRFAYTDLTPTNYMNYLRDTNEAQELGGYPGEETGPFAGAQLTTISNTADGGAPLSPSFIAGIATNNGGIILVEAATNTMQPLVLTIYDGTNQVAQAQLPLSITGVEQMFRSKTMMLQTESGTVPDRLTDESVPNEPPTNDKNFIFLHGYNVNPQQARGWDADIFKRLYWSGSHAKFYGVTWEAADSQVADLVTINLQTNIVNAFNTAPLLNTFLNSLSGTNVVAAHSLGNMVVLSALNDCSNQTINTYFMIDAAVAIEAIDTTATSNPDMYPSAWTNYESSLWASEWHNLWPATDARSTLTWNGRLAGLQNASVYNFYSSGEEVLRDYPSDPPTSYAEIAAYEFAYYLEGKEGLYTWVWQEKLKGLLQGNSIMSSDHGGWQFNQAYQTNIDVDGSSEWEPMSPAAAAELTTAQLQTNAFFNFASGSALPFNDDLALETSSGSSYAQANQNRIISDAIPCLTLPVGANSVSRLAPQNGNDENFDMQLNYENGWPTGRGPAQYPPGTTAFGEWHHSDVRAVADPFTYPLFLQMVTLGNLQ